MTIETVLSLFPMILALFAMCAALFALVLFMRRVGYHWSDEHTEQFCTCCGKDWDDCCCNIGETKSYAEAFSRVRAGKCSLNHIPTSPLS